MLRLRWCFPFTFVWMSLLLASCAQKVSTLQSDVDVNLDAKTGYLLIGIETDYNLDEINLSGVTSLVLSSKDLRRGAQFILIDIPAGAYSVDSIKMNYFWYTKLKEGYWDIEVSPGIVSYVGHLNIGRDKWWRGGSTVELENRSTEAMVFMRDSYPNILQSRKLRYTGPGDDGFLEYLEAEGLK